MHTVITVSGDLLYDRAALLGSEESKRGEIFAVFRKTCGNDRNAVKRGEIFHKIVESAVEVSAVVDAAAENYLRADGDARVGKAAEIGKLFSRKAV